MLADGGCILNLQEITFLLVLTLSRIKWSLTPFITIIVLLLSCLQLLRVEHLLLSFAWHQTSYNFSRALSLKSVTCC